MVTFKGELVPEGPEMEIPFLNQSKVQAPPAAENKVTLMVSPTQ